MPQLPAQDPFSTILELIQSHTQPDLFMRDFAKNREKTHNTNSLYVVFGTFTNDDLCLAAIRFWRRNLSPFGLACFARWLRYRGSTYPESVITPAALPAPKSRFVNNPR
jgi:hypothetical protein